MSSFSVHSLTPTQFWSKKHTKLLNNGVILVKGLLTNKECAKIAKTTLDLQSKWVAAFNGAFSTLGRAYYVDLESNKESTYFRKASYSNRLIKNHLPNLQTNMRAYLSQALGEKVCHR